MEMAHVGIVVLAAGGSSRLGSPKQLLVFDGQTLLRHTLEVATQANPEAVVVVLGAHMQRMETEVGGLHVHVVENPGWQEGIASSIRCGVDAICKQMPHCKAVIMMLCDQLFVTVELLHNLVKGAQEDAVLIAACRYGGVTGVPALFKKDLFRELQQLEGDTGARALMRKHEDRMVAVHFAEGEADIDTPEDYSRLLGNPYTL